MTTHAELAARLREFRARLLSIVRSKGFGDQLDGDFDTLDEAAAALEAHPDWVSVKDRLPPINVPVVAHWKWVKSAFDPQECPDCVAIYNGRIWHHPDDEQDDYVAPELWMTLPAAPKD